MAKCKDIIALIRDTLDLDLQGIVPKCNDVQNSIHSDEEECFDEPKKKRKQNKKTKTEHKK